MASKVYLMPMVIKAGVIAYSDFHDWRYLGSHDSAPLTPSDGQIYFNTSSHSWMKFNVSVWLEDTDILGGISWHPKYYTDILNDSNGYNLVDYAHEAACVISIHDGTPQLHTNLTSNPDVLAAPDDLSLLLTSGAVASVQAYLEGMNIPSEWIDTGDTYAHVLRRIVGVFVFAREWVGIKKKGLFREGLDLSRSYNSLSTSNKNTVSAIFLKHGISTAGLSGQSTIRQILSEFSGGFDGKEALGLGVS